MIDVADNSYSRFAGPGEENSIQHYSFSLMLKFLNNRPYIRISFLRVDEVCDFEVQGEIRLVVLRVACISSINFLATTTATATTT